MHLLWEKYSTEAMYKTVLNTRTWELIPEGRCESLGLCDNRPVMLDLWWARIDGVLVMFHDVVSEVADWKRVRTWLNANLPLVPRTDANNFHRLLSLIDKQGVNFSHLRAMAVQA